MFPLLGLMCATSTEIDIDIYSEVACAQKAEVGVTGSLAFGSPTGATNEVGDGVVIMSDGDSSHGMLALANTSEGTVLEYANHGSNGWGAWTKVDGISSVAAHHWLAGTGCYGGHPILTWTEGQPTQTVVALDVSSLFRSQQ